MVYENMGVHIDNPDGSTDYKWEPGQPKYNMTEGFSFFNMDANGFNNAKIPDGDVDILLMGSSQMEAKNVFQDCNTASYLNKMTDGMFCYNIGISGHTVYHCFKNVKAAVENWHPTKYLVIVIDEVLLDTEKMQSVLNGTFEKIPSADSGILYIAQKTVPAIKSLYRKTKDWREADEIAETAEEMPEMQSISGEYVDLLEEFISIPADIARENDVDLIIVYQPATNTDGNGNFVEYYIEARECFSRICEKKGVAFIDMTADFKEMFEKKHVFAHGFTNTAVGVGHLNKYGHRAIAERITEAIKEHES